MMVYIERKCVAKYFDEDILFVQWNPICEVTPFASEKWSFKRGGSSSGVKINTFMSRFTLSRDLSRGGGLSSVWPLKRCSIIYRDENFQIIP